MGPSQSRSIEFRGQPIEIRYRGGLRDTAGNEAHAATYIRQRLIVLQDELRHDRAEHSRILAHELFHFAWVRLGNTSRLNWEDLLTRECRIRVRGEAGWSAEWRKLRLSADAIANRTRAWREYCCEAFCDTGGLIHTGVDTECTLAKNHLRRRLAWFHGNLPAVPHI